jgi:hypothetical protein
MHGNGDNLPGFWMNHALVLAAGNWPLEAKAPQFTNDFARF